MPVDFLTAEQKAWYGCFSCEPNEIQLARYFLLDKNDLAFIRDRRGKQNRLAVALQLTSARFLGTFLSDINQIPVNVKSFVAQQLSIDSIDVLEDYAQRESTPL
jgi:TnpA family transposase